MAHNGIRGGIGAVPEALQMGIVSFGVRAGLGSLLLSAWPR